MALIVHAGQSCVSTERHGRHRTQGRLFHRVLLAQELDDGFAFRRVVGQRRQQRALAQLFGGHARCCVDGGTTTVTESDGASLVQQQHMHIARCLDSATGLGDHVEAHQTVHTGDADGRQQAANGGRDQRDQQRHQKYQRQAATGKVGERLQGDDHQQEDQRQADQQDVQRHFVGRFLALGAFDQRDHAVQGRFAGVGTDADQQPVGHQPGIASDRRAVAAGFANHRRGFTGNRGLVDGCDAFDDFAVTRNHFADFDAHYITLAQLAGIDRAQPAVLITDTRLEPFATGLEAVSACLATAFGQCFGKVGEQHGKPQPQGNLHTDRGRHLRVGNDTQHRGQNGGQFYHQHHR